MSLDTEHISLTCPTCGRKTQKTIGWVKTNSQFTCTCGTVITLDATEIKREIAGVEAAIEKLKASLKKL